jgi:hypothetical protein
MVVSFHASDVLCWGIPIRQDFCHPAADVDLRSGGDSAVHQVSDYIMKSHRSKDVAAYAAKLKSISLRLSHLYILGIARPNPAQFSRTIMEDWKKARWRNISSLHSHMRKLAEKMRRTQPDSESAISGSFVRQGMNRMFPQAIVGTSIEAHESWVPVYEC